MPKECKKCGECCKTLHIKLFNLLGEDLVEYYLKRGCKIENGLLEIPHKCQNLTEDNLCKIHDNKPYLCKVYGEGTTKGFYIPKGCVFEE